MGIVGTALTADCTVEVAGTPIPVTPVAIDIQPGSCPNAFNPTKKGTLPVAILGSPTLDVRQIDVSLIRLEGIPPLRSTFGDVATPFVPITGRTRATDCTTAGPDGFRDLVVHFDVTALRPQLGLLVNGDARVLKLTGSLKPAAGGIPIAGEDVVLVRLK